MRSFIIYLRFACKKAFVKININPNRSLGLTIHKKTANLVTLFLKKHSHCNAFFLDLTAQDTLGNVNKNPKYRFINTMFVYSPIFNYRIAVQYMCFFNQTTWFFFSISKTYLAAVWSERELYDMFGIVPIGNPDLRKILTDYGNKVPFLRKTIPLWGFNPKLK